MTRAAQQECLDRIREMVLEALADIDAEAWLFGSYARGEAARLSDIDVAVDVAAPLPPGLLARLREVLKESTIPVRVDVVDLSETDADFRRPVRAEGVRWYPSESRLGSPDECFMGRRKQMNRALIQSVIPAGAKRRAGIQEPLDPRFRGGDGWDWPIALRGYTRYWR